MKVQSLSTGETSEEVLPKVGQDKTPCLVDQAAAKGWQAGIFDFGKAGEGDVACFNPSIVERPDGLWLIVRRAVFSDTDRFGMNSLVAFKLDDNLKPEYGDPLKFVDSKPNEHFEDPRAIYFNGQTWIGACNFIWNAGGEWTGAHQTLGVFDDDWVCKRRWDPQIGGNGPMVDLKGARNEKNWLWFFHDSKLTVLYHSNPWRVAQFGVSWEQVIPYETAPGIAWNYGDIRGGTPPVLVDDLYWTFFHSSIGWIGRFRRYYMGAIAFESKPPFTPVHITPGPLLTGSQLDPWAPKKPLVVFPCGALLRKGRSGSDWLITYGVNDLASGYVRIPHADIISLSKPIQAPSAIIDLNPAQLLNSQPSTSAKGGDNHARDRKPAKPRPAAEVAAAKAPINGEARVQPRASSVPTLGDEIRNAVTALESLATNANRKARILRELRRRKLAPRR